MNFRLTAVLFGLVFALAVGLLVLALTAPDPARDTKGPFAALATAGVTDKDVDRVELTRTKPRQESLVFRKADGKWRLTAPADAPVDSVALDMLVKALLDARPAEYAGTLDPALLGLADPGLKITLARGDTAAAVNIGTTTLGGESAVTFFAPADDPKRVIPVGTADLRFPLFRPDAAAKDGDTSFLVKWRSDFRTTQLLGVNPVAPETQVERVAVSVGDKKVELERTGTEWRFAGAWAKYGPADAGVASLPEEAITGVGQLLNMVTTLQTESAADVQEDVASERWKEFGLADGDSEAVQVDVTPAGKPPTWVRIGKVVDEKTKQPALARRYCRVKGDGALFKVTMMADQKERLAAMAKDPAPLRNRDLLPLAKRERYDALDSSVGGFQLRKLGGRWAVYGGGPPPAEGTPQAVGGLLTVLTTPRVALDVLPAPDDTAFDPTATKLTLWADGVPANTTFDKDGKPPVAAPTLKGDPVTLTFGKKVTRKVTVPGGGQEERLVVIVRREQGAEKTDLVVLPELAAYTARPRLAFVNTQLPSFPPDAADGLVLSFKDGPRSEFIKIRGEKDPAYRGETWKAKGADGKAGAVADGDAILDVLGLLATLAATPVAETTSPPAEYGLDTTTPVLRVIVSVRGTPAVAGRPAEPDREVKLLFGNPVANEPKEGPKNVYLRAVDGGVVWTVPADKLDRLRAADLSDKVVLRVPPSKVTTLFLSGWAKEVNGKRETTALTLTLADGVWTTPDAGGRAVDQAAVTKWLGALASVKQVGKAELVDGKEPEAWGFGSAPVSVIAGGADKKSLGMLTLGATDGKGGVYVRLDRDGKQQFYLVDAAAFAPLLGAPPLK